jgi:hypothetical protein
MKIRNRKHVIIRPQDIFDPNEPFDITVPIDNITFQPDEVHIKSAYLNNNPGNNNCYRLYSSLVQNQAGALFLMQDTANGLKMYDLSFPINYPIVGPYRFYIRDNDVNDSILTAGANGGYFYIHLEFIEYFKE